MLSPCRDDEAKKTTTARRNSFCYFFIKNENIFKIDLVYKCAWIIICFIYSLLTKHSHTFFPPSPSSSSSFPPLLFTMCFHFSFACLLMIEFHEMSELFSFAFCFLCCYYCCCCCCSRWCRCSFFWNSFEKNFFFVFLKNRQTKFKMSTSFKWTHTVSSNWSPLTPFHVLFSFNSFTTWISFFL